MTHPNHVYTRTELQVFQHMLYLREVSTRCWGKKNVQVSIAEIARAIGVPSVSTVRNAVDKLCRTGTLVRLDRLGTRKAAGRYTVAARLL